MTSYESIFYTDFISSVGAKNNVEAQKKNVEVCSNTMNTDEQKSGIFIIINHPVSVIAQFSLG